MAEQILNLKTQLTDAKQTQDSLIKALDNSKTNHTARNKEVEMLDTIKNLSAALANIQKRCETAEDKYTTLKKCFSKHLNKTIKDKENPQGSDVKDYNIKITCSDARD